MFKNFNYKSILSVIILIFISVALCSIIFLKLHSIIYSHDDNIKTFYSFKHSFDFYKEVMQKPWKSRLFACAFASLFMPDNEIVSYHTIQDEENDYLTKIKIRDYNMFYVRVGIWTVFWLFLINLLFIILRKNFSLFYMFGIFTTLSFVYIPDIYARVYPWDMPALFFYSLFIFILAKGKLKWLILILPLATGFKETVIILSLIFLVWDEVSLKERIIYTALTLILCIIVKSFLGVITKNDTIFFTMDVNFDTIKNALTNVLSIFNGNFYNLIFINAGTTLAFLILPSKDKYILCLKVIALIFIASNFIYGNIQEYRIFIEIIPFALYGFDKELICRNEINYS